MFCFMLFAVRAQKDRDDDDDSHTLCTFFLGILSPSPFIISVGLGTEVGWLQR